MKLTKVSNRLLFLPPTVQAGWQNESVRTDFDQMKTLGKGSFGQVWQARHKKTGSIYAIKQIKKKSINSPKLLQHVKTEVRIMYLLNHPNIIKLYNHFEDDFSIYFVLEFAQKGELYRFMMNECPQRRLTEEVASKYIRQIIQALIYIHAQNVIHRDIKPENILIDKQGNLKLADFGWSNFVEEIHSKRQTYCGTLDYLAPQMIEKSHKHDYRVDIWSIGVLIYELVNGFGPFSNELLKANCMSEEKVKDNIRKVNYNTPSLMSQEARDLVSKILIRQPENRPSLQSLLAHPWITKYQPKLLKEPQPQNKWLNKLKNEFQQISPQSFSELDNKSIFTSEEIYQCARIQGILNKKIDFVNEKQKEKEIQSTKVINQLQLKIKELQLQNKIKDEQIHNLQQTNQKLTFHLSKDSHEECRLKSQRLMATIREQSDQVKNMHLKILQNQRKLRQYANH